MNTVAHLVLFSLAIIFSSSAFAHGPCAADIEKLCKNVADAHGAKIDCLKSHESELSAACKQHMTVMENEKEKIHESCQGDVQKLCSNVERGGGRVMGCLESHESELSVACKQTIAQEKQMHETMHSCKSEAHQLCSKVVPGEGRMLACLKSHESQLSDACKSAVMNQPVSLQ